TDASEGRTARTVLRRIPLSTTGFDARVREPHRASDCHRGRCARAGYPAMARYPSSSGATDTNTSSRTPAAKHWIETLRHHGVDNYGVRDSSEPTFLLVEFPQASIQTRAVAEGFEPPDGFSRLSLSRR